MIQFIHFHRIKNIAWKSNDKHFFHAVELCDKRFFHTMELFDKLFSL